VHIRSESTSHVNAMLAALSLASSALTGEYSGSKTILGQSINAKLTIKSDSAVDIDITGVAAVACADEPYSYDGAAAINLPNKDVAGDCVHDNLADAGAEIKSISYDTSKDEITVEAKYSFVTVSVVLNKDKYQRYLVQSTTESEHRAWFQQYKSFHRKVYSSASEEAMRYDIFRANLDTITSRNLDGKMGRHFINQFADLSGEEFKAMYLGYKPKRNTTASAYEYAGMVESTVTSAASSIDWRSKSPSVLTPVKDQGQCGSCWAFSATEQIETDVALATGTLYTLSPQQITSCDTVDLGCNGGNTETAYSYVKSAGGLESESEYPYRSGTTKATGTCKATGTKVATIGGYSTVSSRASSESKMVTQIQSSPISVCVDAEVWQTYTSGIVGSSCGTQLDHCVQAVGLNAGGSTPYWIVRNSWGTSWGNSGYIYVQEVINACGIATDATITTGAKSV
jgi:C1A family cysteine protease